MKETPRHTRHTETLQCTIMVVSIEIADNIRQVPLERVGRANVMVPCGREIERGPDK